ETDTKLANKVLIAKKESIQEGAERFRRDLLHNLSNHLVSSTVHGVMSDDVARFLNLLTTTQFYFFIEMNFVSFVRRCWSITKSMESEIVVEDFMNFRTHTR
ncbi:unnamed protein product, partial [Brassica oleracea]